MGHAARGFLERVFDGPAPKVSQVLVVAGRGVEEQGFTCLDVWGCEEGGIGLGGET